jgi:hypothetical protein
MRRLRISGSVTGGCLACCAGALFMIGLTAQGHKLAHAVPTPARAGAGAAHYISSHVAPSVASSDRLLQAHIAPATDLKTSISSSVIEHYKQFPLSFEPNQKQTDNADVKFLARGDGYILFLTGKEAVLSMRKDPKSSAVMRMTLLGANSNPSFTGMEALPGKSNYFIGNKPENWHTNIPTYGKVSERDIYPGVDLVYYGTQRQLEYDFVIAPGTSPSKIQIVFSGAKNLHTDANGDLLLSAATNNDVRLLKPVAYQQVGGEKQLVAANYVLRGKDHVAFSIGNYDQSLPLIVDPILAYSTYLGGSGIDAANAIALASDNTAFVTGSTFSGNYPTIHALQGNRGGGPDFPQDAFVSKISNDGSTLLYSTYLGGSNRDIANGIAVDNSGNAFVIGTTLSADYPITTNSFTTLCGGDGACGKSLNPGGFLVTNAFITKLNAAGTALDYSTFFGFYENVSGRAIAVDADGNAYITGYTTANFTPTVPINPPALPPPPFPISATAFQTLYGGGSTNAFVAKLDATGTTALYSSYLGGEIEDVANGITVDSSANVYVTGLTYSTAFPKTAGALQTTFGGAGDAFVSKVNPGGTALLFSTYLGGAGIDQGNGVALDPAGNVYVAGLTNSAAFGFIPAGFQPAYAGQGDAFVVKLTTGGSLSYFTYLGGSKADAATGIAVDSSANVYVTGSTVSTDFPTAGAVFQPAYGGGNADSFVAKLDPTGKTLIYSSYLGGTNTELASGVAVDPNGSAYVTGQTCSEDFPLANPLQAVPGGNCDSYVAKVSILAGFALNPAGLVFPAQSLNTTSGSQTITVTNGDNAQTISGITISGINSGDFAQTNTCGSGLAVGATCTITVTFTPQVTGLRKASLTITDSAPGSPQVVNLSGSTSTVTLSVSNLAFGNQPIGATSAPQAITATNSGTTPLTFSSITGSGDFAETDNCTKAALQPGTNCVIEVTYSPSAPVASIGAITLTDNGSGSPQEVLVTGTGVLQVSLVSLSATSLTFPGQGIGTTSAQQVVTMANVGSAPVVLSGVTASGRFAQINNCPTSIPVGSSCTIDITFSPNVAGNLFGSVTINDNAAGSPQTIALSGIGTGNSFQVSSLTAAPAVPAGKPANYALSVVSFGGFSQQVALTCSAPATLSCTISPNVVTPTPSVAQSATLTVNTSLRTIAPPSTRITIDPTNLLRRLNGTSLLLLAALLMVMTVAMVRRRPFTAAFGFSVVLLLASVACTGGGSSAGAAAGTPAGNYQVTVVATSGAASSSTTITVQVN